MGFFKKIDTLLKSSDGFKHMQKTELDTQLEENILKAGISKFAECDYADLYLRIDELGGFLILETILVSATNLKSKKGSSLTFSDDNKSLELESDENKIESDFSEAVNKYVTKIDYSVSEEDVKSIKVKVHNKVSFQINGQKMIFSIINQ